MEEKYIIPKDLNEFHYGTRYIVKYLDNTWSDVQTVYSLCYSIKVDLSMLIEEKRIKIIKDE